MTPQPHSPRTAQVRFRTVQWLAGLLCLVAVSAQAQQNVFWRDGSGTDLWENNTNNPWYYQTWNSDERRPDIFPIPTRNFVFIGNNYNTTMDVNSATWYGLGSLTVQAAASSDRTYNATGTAGVSFTIGLYVDSSANQTFNTQIGVDGGTVQFRGNNGSATISLTDNVFLNSNTAQIGGDSSSTSFNISGIVSGSGGTINKVNDNTLTLTGNNTYTGGTTLSGGTLRVGHANALGTGTLTIDGVSGNAKTLSSDSGTARTISNNINLFNALTLGQSSGGTGSLTLGGTVYVGDSGSTRLLSMDGTHQISGPLTGSLGLAKQGSGTLNLSGANTHSGGIYIDNGTLLVSGGSLASSFLDIGGSVQAQTVNNATLEISSAVTLGMPVTAKNFGTGAGTRTLAFSNGSGTPELTSTVFLEKALTISSATQAEISGTVSGTGNLTKTGAGTLTLSGPNLLSGHTVVSQGTLALGSGLVNSPQVSVLSGATLDSTGVSGGYVVSPGAVLSSDGTLTGGTEGYVVNGGTFTQTGGSWTADIFHAQGSAGTISVADLAYSTGGEMIFTVDPGGATAVDLADSNPFALYGGGLTEFASNWELSLAGNVNAEDLPGTITLLTSSTYDLTNLDGQLTLNAKNNLNGDEAYLNIADGQTIYFGGLSSVAAYTASFTSGSLSFDLVQGSIRAIPEPGTLSLLGMSILLLRLKLRKRFA